MGVSQAVIRPMAEVPAAPVDRARGASIQVLIGPNEGAQNFVLRRFTIEPGGRIPAHRHDSIEHEQLVLEGEMILALDGKEHTLVAGDGVFIPAGVAHWYENRRKTPVRFLCVVPKTEQYRTEWLE